jgi:septal ring factor EnvC (AmiA/AmiB activator)
LFVAFSITTVFGQESATQQQIDKLSGQIQDLLEAQAQMAKRIEAQAKEINELRDKVNAPKTEDYANAGDVKSLAEKIAEVDRKRQKDNESISRQIENLGKVVAGAPVRNRTPVVTPKNTEDTATPDVPQKGYYYTVQNGDSWGAIAKAYREQGVKITTAQLIKANPKVNPDVLIVGKKIFIPDPNAK